MARFKGSAHFKGSYVALVTPFSKGRVDLDAFHDLIEWHIHNGTDGFVPCGTTGETPTLSETEHKTLIKTCVTAAKGKVPVLAGTGSNATDKAVDLARFAEKSGADGILVVTPYYNKPTQEGLYRHYKAINDAVGLPIILYNVPSRTGVEIAVDTVIRLAELKNIAGIKDASLDLSRPLQLRHALGDKFIQLSGEDATVGAYLGQGGHGCISVTANVAPKLCAELHDAWQKRDYKAFERARDLLLPLHKALFMETSPAPAKYCLFRLGKTEEDLRLPLVPVSAATRLKLDVAMEQAGIFKTARKKLKKARA